MVLVISFINNWLLMALLIAILFGAGLLVGWIVSRKLKAGIQAKPSNTVEGSSFYNEALSMISGYIWQASYNKNEFKLIFISDSVYQVTQRTTKFWNDWTHARKSLVYKEDLKKFELNEAQILSGEKYFSEIEYRIILPNGLLCWIQERIIVKNTESGTLALSGVCINITAKKEEEEKNSVSSDFLLASINSLTQPLFIKDEQSRLLLVNQSFCALFGSEPEQMIGKTDFDLFPKDEAESFLASDKLVLNGESDFYESKVNIRNQNVVYYISKTLYHSTINDKKYIVGIMNDISVRKKSEELLKQEIQEVKGSTKNKSFFLASMSHEIRTPMNAILGMAELLAESRLNPEQREFIQVINSAGANLLNLINDILDFSKIEAGFLKFESEATDLHELISDVIKMFEFRLNNTDLKLKTHFPATELSPILTDPHRLRQVLINLLNNAVKFTPKGTIDIVVDILNETNDLYQLRISIVDTGYGIPDHEQSKIFQAFEQSSITEGKAFGGTGLGLAISKSIIETFGGNISFMSTEGKGSNFFFDLPFLKAEPIEQVELIKPETKLALKVLIVDDNPTNIALTTTYLKRVGITDVITAMNGSKAVSLYKQHHFDLILMDIQMPVMDGLEATKVIRAYENATKELKPTVIIAVTAYALSSELNRFLSYGMDGFLRKPFTGFELQNAIENALQIKIIK